MLRVNVSSPQQLRHFRELSRTFGYEVQSPRPSDMRYSLPDLWI